MFPGINPKKMQAIMSQMGIKQEEIDANRVIIETSEKNIIINNPSVVKIDMKGQENFQISGDIEEEETNLRGETSEKPLGVLDEETKDNTDEDIKTIMEKTNCLEQEAKLAYEKANNDLTEAILSLS